MTKVIEIMKVTEIITQKDISTGIKMFITEVTGGKVHTTISILLGNSTSVHSVFIPDKTSPGVE